MAGAAQIKPDTLLITVNDVRLSNGEALFRVAIMDPSKPRTAINAVDRTFLQLKPVMRKLMEVDADADLPEVPQKMFGALESPFIEAQRAAMEEYLNAVAASKLLCYDVDFLAFVGYDVAAKECMMRSHLLLELNNARTLRSCFATLLYGPRDEEDSITAARCWLRSRDDYTFVKTLPRLTHPWWPSRKTTLLIEDSRRNRFVLTTQPISHISLLDGAGSDKIKRVRAMLQRLSPTVFAPLTEMEVLEGNKLLCVRPFFPAGSLADLLHDATSPLDETKFDVTANGLSSSRLHQAAQETFKIVRACHEYGFTVPNLLLGNLLVTIRDNRLQLALSGMEDILAGNSWLPLQSVSPEDQPRRTHLDVLLFGAILFQLATGRVLNPDGLHRLLMCQGDVFDDNPALPHTIAPQHHLISPTELARCIPEAASLLHYVFHPTVPADIRVLIYHGFLRGGSNVVETPDGLYAEPAGEGVLAIKKKDLEIVHEQIQCWGNEWERKRLRDERLTRERERITGRQLTSIIEQHVTSKERRLASAIATSEVQVPPPVEPVHAPPLILSAVMTIPAVPNMPELPPQTFVAQPPPVALGACHAAPSTVGDVVANAVPPPPRQPPLPPDFVELL